MQRVSIFIYLVLSILCHAALVWQPTGASSPTPANDNPHESYFLSLRVEGDCQLSIKELHSLNKPPSHAWFEKTLPEKAVDLKTLDKDLPVPPSSSSPPSAMKYRFLVSAHTHGGKQLLHPFLDPRYIRLHGPGHEMSEEELSKHGKAHGHDKELKLPSATEHIWLPKDTKHFDVYCQNTSTRMRFPVDHLVKHRAFKKLEEQDVSIDVKAIQVAGPPNKQINIVFLAGGFTQSEKEKFIKNATDLTELLNDPAMNPRDRFQDDDGSPMANMHRSVPFNRYWSFFNVYAVFQASKESGASRPTYDIKVDNNLKCQHPVDFERAPYCDRDLAVALADVSPAEAKADPGRTVIITIINTPIYGGTGIYQEGKLHLGNFFNGYDMSIQFQKNKMLSLVDHELGHAFGNLADEYSTNEQEPEDRPLLNCQIGDGPNPPSKPRWQHWIDIYAKSSDFTAEYGNGIIPDDKTPWGVLSVPAPVCGFTNYFKPADSCMMFKLDNFFMCPVCREKSTMTMMKNKFLYSWPRYPLEDPITLLPVNPPEQGDHKYPILSANSTLVLHLPVSLLHSSFKVTWTDTDGSEIPPDPKHECPVCVSITPEMIKKYPLNTVVEITATIKDNTVFLSNDETVQETVKDQINQTTTFKLRVSDDIDSLPNVTLEEGALRNSVGEHENDLQMIYTQCPQNANNGTPVCSLNFTNKAYKAPPPLEDLSQYDSWVFIVMGGVALFFLLLWMFAASKYGKRSNGVVRPIFETEFSCFISLVRKIMLFSAVCFMAASLAAMGLATYYYTKTSAIGKYIIIAGVSLAAGLYVLAFVGFWAVSSRSKRMLVINGCLMAVALAVLIALGVLTDEIGTQIKDDKSVWFERLQTLWGNIVADSPDRACAIQQWLECSGFNSSCTQVVGSSLYCPKGCDQINYRYPAPCRSVIQAAINDNYTTILSIVGSCGGLVLGGIVLNFILFGALMKMKMDIRKRLTTRVDKSVKNSSSGTGSTNDSHRALFLLQSLDDSDTKKLLREFKRIDIDGNGELDRTELFIFFKKALMYKPTKEEIDVIMKVGDLDGDGTISIKEFLALFGKAPIEGETPEKSAETKRKMQARLAQQGFHSSGPQPSAGAPGAGSRPVAAAAGAGVLTVPESQPNYQHPQKPQPQPLVATAASASPAVPHQQTATRASRAPSETSSMPQRYNPYDTYMDDVL